MHIMEMRLESRISKSCCRQTESERKKIETDMNARLISMGRVSAALIAVFAVASMIDAEETRLPSSWNRCSCSVAPVIKTATEACSSKTKNDELRDCILKGVGVFDGKSFDFTAAEQLIDKFNATSQQKESLKKSLQSCEPQSRHDADKLRTCSANVLRRRCLTDPKTVCNKREE